MSCGKLPTVKGRLSIIISGCPRFYDVRVLTDLPYQVMERVLSFNQGYSVTSNNKKAR